MQPWGTPTKQMRWNPNNNGVCEGEVLKKKGDGK